jgi:fatty-acyl-CoA synthase
MARGVDLPFLLRRAARNYGNHIAADDGLRTLTLGGAVERAERVANGLDDLGVPPGASIGILSENRSEYIEADLAIALARRVRVALNARLHQDDHRWVAGDCDMRVLIHSASFAAEAATLRDAYDLLTISLDDDGETSFESIVKRGRPGAVSRPGSPEDAAWITYTSGTTGRPKGVVLSHRSIREVAFNLLLEIGPVEPGELLVMTQPLSHGAGYWVLPALISGAGIYVMRKFDPEESFAVGERPNVRILKCVPAMLPPLMDVDDSSALRYETVVYGASPISRPVLTGALERFGPVLVQIYGQSEAPVTLTCLHKEDHLGDGNQRFSAGRAFRSVAVEIWDDEGNTMPIGEEGEVAVTGSHVMTQYLGLDAETKAVFQDGWIRTRDMGVIDERGFLQLLGRRDEMINSGGYNIAPREVENVLSQFPGVVEVAVCGIPDDRWGNVVGAAVKLDQGVSATAKELIDFAKVRLDFRAPKRVVFVEALPRTAYGKIDQKGLLSAIHEPGS